jgi:toxin FitB
VNGRIAYLLDTNVLSETRKKKPDAGVIGFLQSSESSALYISVLTLGELRKGVIEKKRTDPVAAQSLATWVDGFEWGFADRILGIDATIAKLWGEWSGERPRAVVDTLLAATAMQHKLTLVTRDIRHVRGLPIKILNPWKA